MIESKKSSGLEENTNNLKRLVNKDGSFNIIRKGQPNQWMNNFYHTLIDLSWFKFSLFVSLVFVVFILIFSFIYTVIQSKFDWSTFYDSFFYSAQTLTTADFGCTSPPGTLAKLLSLVEALAGIIAFAIATGICYGRFAKPDAKIRFSKNMVIAPFNDKTALQFKICNTRNSNLIEVEATLLFTYYATLHNRKMRRYTYLSLEREKVSSFPLPWVISHPIEESSPLYKMDADALKACNAEFLVLIKAYDDTFSQNVNLRFSYRYDEIIWGAKFKINFDQEINEKIVIEMNRMDEYEVINLNK